MPDSSATTTAPARLPLVAVECTGADAVTFLHGQLSNDIANLDAGHSALAAYCSPKGRVLGLMRVWRTPDGCRFVTDAALAPAVLKRLTMFILRAKVKLAPLVDHAVAGVAGPPEAFARAGLPCPGGADGVAEAGDITVLAVPGAPARHLLTGPAGALADTLARAGLAAIEPAAWTLADIRAGLAQVSSGTQELFVPQQLNLDLTGAINFRKGCYPGQEIVARMHYRGRPTRRMVRLALDDGPVPAPGSALYAPDADQPAAEVVCAAPVGDAGAGCELLAVVQLGALGASLHAGAPDGPAARRLDLPYVVPELAAPA